MFANKKLLALLISLLLFLLVAAGSIFVINANNINSCIVQSSDTIEEKVSKMKLSLEKITNKEYGEIEFKEVKNIGGKEILISEDKKFKYRVSSKNSQLIDLIVKNYSDAILVKDKKVSKEQIDNISIDILNKYYPPSKECKYQMTKYWYKDTACEKTHLFEFDEVAANGIKTGRSIALDLNNAGELVLTASHSGNLEVALNTDNKINKTQAVQIAENYIRNNFPELKRHESFSIKIAELKVWKDRLSWHIKTDNIKAGKSSYGYVFYIDAENGKILFKDYYFVLGR